MAPSTPLPISDEFKTSEEYVNSLLHLVSTSDLLRTLCGGVHVLDFFTRDPDLYSQVLPPDWRDLFREFEILDILDLLMREDPSSFKSPNAERWRNGRPPPQSLVEYISVVRKHLLRRHFHPPSSVNGASQSKKAKDPPIPRHTAIGMNVKKIHEVGNFAAYVDRLTAALAAENDTDITHIVDFGSGQNYLGRTLASEPYHKHIIAVESRQHNVVGARDMDIKAGLASKPLVMRNKKLYRKEKYGPADKKGRVGAYDTDGRCEPAQGKSEDVVSSPAAAKSDDTVSPAETKPTAQLIEATLKPMRELLAALSATNGTAGPSMAASGTTPSLFQNQHPHRRPRRQAISGHGSIQYIEHSIRSGDLSPVLSKTDFGATASPSLLTISLHSCGNLLHHGLRSLTENPSTKAVALIGCCYNLMTERLGPPTYKLPNLRPNHPRLEATSNARDPHGFPMSERLCRYQAPRSESGDGGAQAERGIRLNITARMMAVQAPQNWGPEDSDSFFTRHFYRALLQRIFLDRGVVPAPPPATAAGDLSTSSGVSPAGGSDGSTAAIVVGALKKSCYKDFTSYVRGAVDKLLSASPTALSSTNPDAIDSTPTPELQSRVRESMTVERLTDQEIQGYMTEFGARKKDLSILWSLMAFSAGVIEAVVVADRYLWLTEQEEVGAAWVESVFEFGVSPRNLVVVGVKKQEERTDEGGCG